MVKIGIDARTFTGYWETRGISKFSRFFLEQNIDTNRTYFFCHKKSTSTSKYKFVNCGTSFYPFWENIILPYLLWKYKCEIFIAPMNTMPLFFLKKVKKTLIIHDLIAFDILNYNNVNLTIYNRLAFFYKRLLFKKNAQKADYIITVSQHTKERIFKLGGIDPDKVLVLYNTISDEWIEEKITGEREKYFLCVTGNAPSKNLQGTLAAFALFKKTDVLYKLKIVGLKAQHQDIILEFVQKLGIANYVEFYSNLNNTELMNLYRRSKALISFSFLEGFGIPLLEAMYSGTLVICSNTSSYPEVVGDFGIYADPNDLNHMCQAIKYGVSLNKDTYISITSSAKKRAISIFSKEIFDLNSNKFWNFILSK